MNIHPFVQLVAVIWFFAALATFRTKDSDCIAVAGIVTVCAGIGYLFLHSHP